MDLTLDLTSRANVADSGVALDWNLSDEVSKKDGTIPSVACNLLIAVVCFIQIGRSPHTRL